MQPFDGRDSNLRRIIREIIRHAEEPHSMPAQLGPSRDSSTIKGAEATRN